jgi:hypothetical protein
MDTDQERMGARMQTRTRLQLTPNLCSSAFICGSLLLAGCGGSGPPEARPIAGSASMGVAPSSGEGEGDGSTSYTAVESIEPWSYNSSEGRLVRTPHYRLFTTQSDSVLNARVPLFLESALAAYRTCITSPESYVGTELLPEPSLKLDTYILRTRADWALLTRQTTGDQADMFLRIRRGGFAFGGKALLFDIGSRDTLSIAAHEGWHQYTQRAFQRPLPIWLEEGMATYMEGYRYDGRGSPRFLPWFNTERFDQLRRGAAQNKLMTLPALLESAPQNLMGSGNDDALTYYAQVWALTHFLSEGAGGKYRAAFATVLKDAASGAIDGQLTRTFGANDGRRVLMQRRGPGVFAAYFGELGEAAGEYNVFLRKLVEPGSRSAIVAGESPMRGTGR